MNLQKLPFSQFIPIPTQSHFMGDFQNDGMAGSSGNGADFPLETKKKAIEAVLQKTSEIWRTSVTVLLLKQSRVQALLPP